MKITKFGNQSQSGQNKTPSKQSIIFRNRYQVGQVLHGKLLKWEQPELGWVEVQDLTLLAQIMSTPSPGALLTFRVEQLYPEIILKELAPGAEGEEGSYKTPQESAGDFISIRARFESRSLHLFARAYTSCKPGFAQFTDFLKSNTEHANRYFAVLNCVKELNSFSQSATIMYMPWLIPEAMNHEALVTGRKKESNDHSFYEMIISFTHPATGAARLKIMYKNPTAGFKLTSKHKVHSQPFELIELPNTVNYLGCDILPREGSSGVLSDFFNLCATY